MFTIVITVLAVLCLIKMIFEEDSPLKQWFFMIFVLVTQFAWIAIPLIIIGVIALMTAQ